MHEAKKHRVLIVDDHQIVRDGLAHLISIEADLVVCAQADDVRAAKFAVQAIRTVTEPTMVRTRFHWIRRFPA
jgi:YesN/AraC family two-component response regulator